LHPLKEAGEAASALYRQVLRAGGLRCRLETRHDERWDEGGVPSRLRAQGSIIAAITAAARSTIVTTR